MGALPGIGACSGIRGRASPTHISRDNCGPGGETSITSNSKLSIPAGRPGSACKSYEEVTCIMKPGTHGPQCGTNTRVWFKCKACGEKMFFFRCRHGCAVPFAELGQP